MDLHMLCPPQKFGKLYFLQSSIDLSFISQMPAGFVKIKVLRRVVGMVFPTQSRGIAVLL